MTYRLRTTAIEQSKEKMAVLIVSRSSLAVFKNRLIASHQKCWIRDSVWSMFTWLMHIKSPKEIFYYPMLFYWDTGSCYIAQASFKALAFTEPVTWASQVLGLQFQTSPMCSGKSILFGFCCLVFWVKYITKAHLEFVILQPSLQSVNRHASLHQTWLLFYITD